MPVAAAPCRRWPNASDEPATKAEAVIGVSGSIWRHPVDDENAADGEAARGRGLAQLRVVAPAAASPAAPPDEWPQDLILDEALLAALVAGEAEALGVLYDRHAPFVFAILLRILRDRDGAEELLQEVFLRVWQQATTFDEARGSVRCWMNGIAHNLALNELRRRQRRPQTLWRMPGGDREPDPFAGCVDPAPDPAVAACAALRDAEMARALEQLSSGQRTVVELYAAGFSQSEIAVRLDEPLGTVKSRMRRGLCQLREALPALGIDHGWQSD